MELAPSISSSTPSLSHLRFVRQSFHLRNSSSSLMGRASILLLLLHLLLLFLTPSLSWPREPNTDGFFVVEFLRQMGAALPSENGAIRNSSSSSMCPREVSCEVEGERVVRLVASGVGLRGSMPGNTIGKLGMLRQLDLSFNNITAFSTDFWGLGSSLQKLDLSFNTINGSLPNDVGNLGKLQVLNLSFNLLSGRIPPNVGSLGGLMHLNLSHNSIHGSVPKDILQCKSLVSMDLSSNNLSSSFPRDLRNLRDLQDLNLAGNMITGALPNFSGLEFLRYLNLSSNTFVDSISGALHRPLQVVDLSCNHFTGHISRVSLSSHLLPSLTYLDLSSNRLSGALFANLHEARSLRHLDVANNRLSHENFPRIGELSKLEFLSLSGIGLTGKMPDELVKLSNLRVLDLSWNHLVGQIPSLSTERLQILDLSRNNLTGEIPLDLQRGLLHIPSFNLSYNNLTFCSSSFPSKLLNSAFIGSHNDCPIAANPEYAKRVRDGHWKRNVALAIAFSSLFFLMGLICLALVFRKRSGLLVTKQVVGKEDPNISGPFSFETDSTTWVADVKDANSVPVVIFEKPLLDFTFADLLSATSNFDRGTLLAEGKFGPVYRGLLPAGFNVAIKVLVHGSTLTDQEAAMEFERLGRIKHPNLVPLTGYCLAGDQRIAVYDYMEHGNLQNLLHDLPLGVQTEDWSNDTWEDDNDGVHSITSEGQTTWKFRHRIALGTARALAFLHHGCIPQIIHKDVKASSVYLDSAFEPRLSDFGLAKIFGSNFEDEIARVSPGYTPPELSGSEPSLIATSKSDVYAFGVVLFELITGKKPTGDEYPEEKDATLVSWVRGLLKRGQLADAIDQKIYETGELKKMEEALRVGYLCTADSPSKRPSMQQIVGLLKDIDPGASYQWG